MSVEPGFEALDSLAATQERKRRVWSCLDPVPSRPKGDKVAEKDAQPDDDENRDQLHLVRVIEIAGRHKSPFFR